MAAPPDWLTSAMDLEFTDDPAAFLDATRAHLAADPVVTTVIATVSERMAGGGRSDDLPYRWWVTARDGAGRVVGVGMRTAPFEPYPAYLLPMPDEAAVAIARALHERGEVLGGVNGALESSTALAHETARLTGGTVAVHEHTRLFELGDLVVPPSPPGRLRAATHEDAGLALAWFRDFGRAAAEQAGREGEHASPTASFTAEEVAERIDAGVIWLWEDADGTPVHLTGFNPPANGVARVGPVYTPAEHRGRGYASAAVAEVSRMIVDGGARACLFTDQANPTSNKIYEALGYRPVVDMVSLLVD